MCYKGPLRLKRVAKRLYSDQNILVFLSYGSVTLLEWALEGEDTRDRRQRTRPLSPDHTDRSEDRGGRAPWSPETRHPAIRSGGEREKLVPAK